MSISPSAPPDASTTQRGLMSAADKTKLDAQSGTNTGDVTVSSPAGWLSRVGQALTFALVSASSSVAGVVDLAAQTFAGVKTFASAIIASAGIQVASLWNTNGTSASDVGVKAGFSTEDGNVNGSAKPFSVRTGTGGTEVEHFYVTKGTADYGGATIVGNANHVGLQIANNKAGGTTAYIWVTASGAGEGARRFLFGEGSTFTKAFIDLATGDIGAGSAVGLVILRGGSGRIDQSGTDSSGSPGAATINKPTGISAIAADASSVVITNSLVTASSRVIITPHARDATCKELIVTRAAGSFTVSGSANATAALPFSWEVSTIL